MKLFWINDCEWVIAETLDEALSFYRAATGCEPISDDEEVPFEVDEATLPLVGPRVFVDVEGDYGAPGMRHPFPQALALFTDPVIISTEY